MHSKEEDRELFKTMLNDYYKYSTAINAKGQPFPAKTITYSVIAFTV
jgi:hypothetical protein